MSMKEAIGMYFPTDTPLPEAFSVDIGFETVDGEEDETQFDLYADDKATELEDLWNTLARELRAKPNGILYLGLYSEVM